MRIPFGPWRPDIAELDAGVAAVAENVLPGENSYLPAKASSAYSMAMSAAPVGLCMAQQQAGNFLMFAGTQTTLNKLNPSTLALDDVSRTVGGAYSVPDDEFWSFAQFGTNLLAANINDVVQAFDLEAGSNFAALSGSPPQGRILAVMETHVFIGSLSTDANAISWSGIENAAQWTYGSNGSDTQSFPDGGRVMNIASASKLIVQERAVRRAIHTPGSAAEWAFEKMEDLKGTVAPYSVVSIGSSLGYLSEYGFYFNGQPIGKDAFDQFFLSEVNQSRLFKVLGSVDPTRPLIYWDYHTGSSETFDRRIVYNWKTGKASVVSITHYIAAGLATPGISLEGLDTPYPSLDADVPYSLDSRVWLGGRPVPAVIGSDLKVSFLEGATLEATLETGEVQAIPGRRAVTKGFWPIVDGSGAESAVGRVGTRNRQGDTRTWSTEVSQQNSGIVPVKAGGRFHRFRVRIPAGTTWTHAQGVDAEFASAGKR